MLRQLSLAVEQSLIGIVVCNLAGRIEFVNEATLRISGFSRDEAMGQSLRRLLKVVPPTEREGEMRAALVAGQRWQGEFGSLRKSGEPYQVFVHVAPVRQPDGPIAHFVFIGEDTEKKRLGAELDRHRPHLQELVDERSLQIQQTNAELLLARDHAEAANRAKSSFLANMSHEIRTPLNSIVGLTHLLSRDARDAKTRERLGKVTEAAGHLLQVISDVLDLSKIEADKIELESIDFSLADVYLRVLRQFTQHYRDGAEQLAGLMARGAWDALKCTAHSIKGAAAAIGALRLPALADTLERTLATAHPAAVTATALAALEQELRSVVAALHAGLPEEARVAGSHAGAVPADMLDRLEALLHGGDYESVALFHSLAGDLRAQHGTAVDAIEAALSRFDRPGAEAALRALRAG